MNNVALTIADSAREPTRATLATVPLPVSRRAGRAALRGAAVFAAGAVVAVLPLLHICGALVFVVAGPVAVWMSWRTSVLTAGEQHVACPKCAVPVAVDAGLSGWPVRLHCGACGVTFSASPVH